LRILIGRIGASLLLFVLAEAALFRSGLWVSILEPSSSTGTLETRLRNERIRPVRDHNQVLGIGDSRMAMLPRMANEAGAGYWFASIAVAGTTPRCWYYMLRDTDPTARRYRAVVVTVDDYDLRDIADQPSERISDLHYVVAHVGLRELAEFAGSFRQPEKRWMALRGLLFKGTVYQRDFQEFLLHPAARLALVKLVRAGSAQWAYDFVPDNHSLAGLAVNWKSQTIQYPAGTTDAERELIRQVLFPWPAPQNGAYAAFYSHWLGRIVEHYRGSGTKLILLQLPRAPVIRPNPPPRPESPLRALARRPDVILLDEHYFDSLERPELFGDPYHLNREGIRRFSRMLAEEVRRILGPPVAANAL
jgi:hypothetical protein